jgi:hypothetical protein
MSAVAMTDARNTASRRRSKMLDRIVTSGMLAPMPAITIASIGPRPTPAASSPAPMGNAASPRR